MAGKTTMKVSVRAYLDLMGNKIEEASGLGNYEEVVRLFKLLREVATEQIDKYEGSHTFVPDSSGKFCAFCGAHGASPMHKLAEGSPS